MINEQQKRAILEPEQVFNPVPSLQERVVVLETEEETADQKAALNAANSPDAENPFVTIEDLNGITGSAGDVNLLLENLISLYTYHNIDAISSGSAFELAILKDGNWGFVSDFNEDYSFMFVYETGSSASIPVYTSSLALMATDVYIRNADDTFIFNNDSFTFSTIPVYLSDGRCIEVAKDLDCTGSSEQFSKVYITSPNWETFTLSTLLANIPTAENKRIYTNNSISLGFERTVV